MMMKAILMLDMFILIALEMFLRNMWPMVTDGRSWGQAGSAELPPPHFVAIRMVCKGLSANSKVLSLLSENIIVWPWEVFCLSVMK